MPTQQLTFALPPVRVEHSEGVRRLAEIRDAIAALDVSTDPIDLSAICRPSSAAYWPRHKWGMAGCERCGIVFPPFFSQKPASGHSSAFAGLSSQPQQTPK